MNSDDWTSIARALGQCRVILAVASDCVLQRLDGPRCITNTQGFGILGLEPLVLRNVLVATNHVRLDAWALDPPTNKKDASGDSEKVAESNFQMELKGAMVPKMLVEEKEQELLVKEETIQILHAKVRRLEHLVHLKDVRIDDLQVKLDQLEKQLKPTTRTNKR